MKRFTACASTWSQLRALKQTFAQCKIFLEGTLSVTVMIDDAMKSERILKAVGDQYATNDAK